MKKISQIKAGAMLSYIALVLGIGIQLIYIPFAIDSLGEAEYGIFALVNSTIAYLTVMGFGFESAIVRYTTQYKTLGDKGSERRLHGMFFVLYGIIGIVVLVLGCILAYNTPLIFGAKLTPDQVALTTKLMYLAAINVAITFPFSIFASITTAYEQFVYSRAMQIFRNVLNPLLMMSVLLLGAKSVGMILAATFINLLFGTLNVVYCIKKIKIKFTFTGFDKPLLKEIVVFSFFIFLGTIVDRLYWSTGQVLLGILSGAAVITFFSLAVQLNNYYQQLSAAISNLFLPRVTAICAREHTNKELTTLMIKVGRVQFFVLALALTGFALVGKQFIRLWVGSDYDIVYYMAMTIFIPITVPLVQNIGISILQAKNKHAFRAITYLIIAICNVIITIPLIKLYGVYGTAIAIAVSYTLGQIITMNIYYHKVMGLNMFRFWGKIICMLPSIALPVGLELLFMKLVPLGGGIGFIVYSGVYVCLYALSLFIFGLNKRERNMFLGPVKKILQGRGGRRSA